ncbi:hypothetical protein [Sphingomonas sp.]|uniref:hypothetical protein n=1 Tax=Sphingomonas sp. TaxID=28214 RepID=UPI0031D460D2
MLAALTTLMSIGIMVGDRCRACAAAFGVIDSDLPVDWPALVMMIFVFSPISIPFSVAVAFIPALFAMLALIETARVFPIANSRLAWMVIGVLIGIGLAPILIVFLQTGGAPSWDQGSVGMLRIAGGLSGAVSAAIGHRSLLARAKGRDGSVTGA